MKIDLDAVDQTQFMIHAHILNGETVYLVQPQHIGCRWNQQNKIFRSSLWDGTGNLISAGMPKFTNWGENPEHFPVPQSLKDCKIVEKLDGSLLIVTKYKGQHILRTRGTVDAHKLDNGHELAIFEQDILPRLEGDSDTWGFSILFEWVSPVNRIILNYGDTPKWYLVGIIYHADYRVAGQEFLDQWAEQHGLLRPTAYKFPTVEALMKDVETWKGKEGVVIYSPVGMHKVKGLWYLALHRMKEALSSLDKVIDVWYEQNEPDYNAFEQFITGQFDYELWSQVRGDVSRICDASNEVKRIIAGMQKYVTETLLPLGDPMDKKVRGQQARQVVASYGITNRANFVFTLLDGKQLGDEDRKKLLYQVLKK